MRNRLFNVVALLLLSCFFITFTNDIFAKSPPIDSINSLIKNAVTDQEKAQLLLGIGKTHFDKEDFQQAINAYYRALSFVNKEETPALFALVNLRLGNVLRNPKVYKTDSSLVHLEIAKDLMGYLSEEDRLQCLVDLVTIYYSILRFEDAMKHCLDCIDLAKKRADKNNLMVCLSRMAIFSEIHLNDTAKVFDYSNRALAMALESKDPKNISRYYHLHAVKIINHKDPLLALPLLDSTEKYLALMPNYDYHRLGDITRARGTIYRSISNYPKAEFYFNKALEIVTKHEVVTRRMQYPLDIAQLSLLQKNYQKAITSAKDALTVSPKLLTLFELKQGNKYLYKGYLGLMNYQKALHHFEQWKFYVDSVKQINNLGIIAGLENKYTNEKQQKQIAVQETEIAKQAKQQQLFIGFFLLMTALLAALFGLYYRTRKSREEIKKKNQIILDKTEELQALDKVKTRFFANVSHELRTPLTLMLGPISSALKSEDLNNRNFTLLKLAQQSGKDLLRLIGSILDLSKIESGKVELIEKPVAFFTWMRRIISSFESYAENEEILFTFNYQVEKDLQLNLDEDKLEVILNNLLSNAIKFTPRKGHITVEVKDEGNVIQIIVKDTGRGIHNADLPNVFNRFYQSKRSDLPAEGGTGIGLALSQEFVKLMKGEIWVESELGKGSIFHVKIPRVEVIRTADSSSILKEETVTSATIAKSLILPVKNKNKPISDAKLLIVEDNQSLRSYIATVLSPFYEVIAKENGRIALDYLENLTTPTDLPHLILSDVMMPEMDGFQLLKALKQHTQFKQVPIIMLTARAELQDKLKALRIGVDDYLLKPFNEEELLVRIENLLQNAQERDTFVQLEQTENESTTIIFSQEEVEWLEQVENLVQQQIPNIQFSIPKMANELAMSERNLQRQLKKLTGLTPNKYLQEMRLTEARKLLETKQFSTISKVAYAVGFSDAKAFSRRFKQRFGKSPSEY